MDNSTKARFLEALARCRAVDPACRKVGVGRSSVYHARNTDPAFAAAWAEALGETPAPQQMPGRIEVEQLTPEQRRLARAFLASLDVDPPGSTQERARLALERWLTGAPWIPLSNESFAELERLSKRAAADYREAFPLPVVLAHPENTQSGAVGDASACQSE